MHALRALGAVMAASASLSACALPLVRRAPEGEARLCAGLESSFECARALERARLRHTRGRVVRSGDSLTLQLETGSAVVLVDTAPHIDAEVHYSYRAFVREIGYHLVHVQLFEGVTWALVHARSGRRYWVDAPPVVSPARRRFVTASWDLEAGFSANAVRIWRVLPDSLVEEWALEPPDWGPDTPAWLDESTIRLMRIVPEDDPAGSYRTVPALLVRGPHGWRLRPAPPAATAATR